MFCLQNYKLSPNSYIWFSAKDSEDWGHLNHCELSVLDLPNNKQRNAPLSIQSSFTQLSGEWLLHVNLTPKLLLSIKKLSANLTKRETSLLSSKLFCVYFSFTFLTNSICCYHLCLRLGVQQNSWHRFGSLQYAKSHTVIKMQLCYKLGNPDPQHLPQQSTICANYKIFNYANNLSFTWFSRGARLDLNAKTSVYLPNNHKLVIWSASFLILKMETILIYIIKQFCE